MNADTPQAFLMHKLDGMDKLLEVLESIEIQLKRANDYEAVKLGLIKIEDLKNENLK